MKLKRTTAKPGPKGVFRKEHVERAYKLCLLGLTDKDLAEAFGVKENTIYSWTYKHEAFAQALRKGRQEADANVAKSLYQRAVGYSYEDTQIFKRRVTEYNEEGKPVTSYDEFVPVPVIKHLPPDTKAAVKWLANRQRSRWQENNNGGTFTLNHNHNVTHTHEVLLLQEQIQDPTQFTDQELELVAKLGMNALLPQTTETE